MNKLALKLQRGFTLIEVLIALIIIAIALSAILVATTNGIRFTSELKNRIGAHWAGLNVIAQEQAHAIETPLPTENSPINLQSKEFGHQWQVQVSLVPQDGANFKEIQVQVKYDNKPDSHALATLNGFVRVGS